MMDPFVFLSKYTYAIRHNPNCPMPFEVRTCGDAPCVMVGDPRNLVTYGKTMEEAAKEMVHELNVIEWKRMVP